jgi:glycosyltransferase involved in cell wall biosynthesis
MSTPTDAISLVCTVRDEEDNIGALLESMLAQTHLPDEIVVNDCKSLDRTAEIVKAYARRDPMIRLVHGGVNISSGRNSAILHARHAIIACTDAGLRLAPTWLEHIVRPIVEDDADLVGGYPHPAPQTTLEGVIAAANYRDVHELATRAFVPYGQSTAFRIDVWRAVGGYPEWLDHCEDIFFANRARAYGYRIRYEPRAVVYFRPRATLPSLARQYFNYARGDAVGGLFGTRHAIRYSTYATGLALLSRRSHASALICAVGASAYLKRPYRRFLTLFRPTTVTAMLDGIALLPVVRATDDLAKMAGYPVGLLQRYVRQRRPPASD